MDNTQAVEHIEITEEATENTTPVMSAADQGLFDYYASFDSRDMPNSMAVNQHELAQEASVAAMPQENQSKYYGVYNNTNAETVGEVPFRAAVKLNGYGKAKPYWLNLGYFNCEHVAALAYNTAAINKFGDRAWLNPVDSTLCNQDTLHAWEEKQHKHIATAKAKAQTIYQEGKNFNMVDLENSERV